MFKSILKDKVSKYFQASLHFLQANAGIDNERQWKEFESRYGLPFIFNITFDNMYHTQLRKQVKSKLSKNESWTKIILKYWQQF
jgi:hypothetical protein